MPEHMRCCAAKINLLSDPLPHSFEGGLRNGFAAISDDKPIDLAARLEKRRKLLIKRNQPVSGVTLCLADDWPVVLVCDGAFNAIRCFFHSGIKMTLERYAHERENNVIAAGSLIGGVFRPM